MNAVNLIPSDSRRRRASISTGRPTLALMGGLMVALVAAVLYVSAVNDVTTRKSELAGVTASAASWRAAATSYTPFVQAARQRTQQLAAVRQLAAARFPWSQLLSQIGGLMPAASELTSLQATTTAGTGTAAAATSAAPQPTVQLSGCAASHSTVAQTMVQLHRVQGVSAVTLSSSTDTSPSGSASGSASSAASQSGSGNCAFPVQFQVSLTFAPTSPSISGGSSTASAAATSASAPAASGPPTSGGASSAPATPTSSPPPVQ